VDLSLRFDEDAAEESDFCQQNLEER
jgi:hypothetical protein